jgi:hypothetical protein
MAAWLASKLASTEVSLREPGSSDVCSALHECFFVYAFSIVQHLLPPTYLFFFSVSFMHIGVLPGLYGALW